MFLRLLTIQQQWATKKVLAVFVLVYFIFPLYLLPKILPEGRPLDLHLYYSPADAYALIESYGELNRAAYIAGSATIDMLYPLVYATFLGLVLSFFIVRIYPQGDKRQFIRLFPYSILIADVLENIAIMSMLSIFPERNDHLALLASTMTSIKWLLFFIVMMMLVYYPVKYYNKGKTGFRPKKSPE